MCGKILSPNIEFYTIYYNNRCISTQEISSGITPSLAALDDAPSLK